MFHFMNICAIILLSLMTAISQSEASEGNESKPIICYLTFWGKGKDLQPETIDRSLCTHIIVGFASVSNNSVQAGEDKQEYFSKVVKFKETNPDLKVMFSIGGGGKDSGFTQATKTAENRKMFIDSILELIDKLKLDGVDIDWEFPAWFSPAEDRENLVLFLKDFREVIDKRQDKLLLSVAVAAKVIIIAFSYDIPGLAKYCDFINLMTYGFHDYKPIEEPYTGYNSPLFSRSDEVIFASFNMAYAAEYWVSEGTPRSKLYVGVPVYAHTYTLALASQHKVYNLAVGGGQDWSYSQTCKFISNGAKVEFDNQSMVPYAYKDRFWVSYENEKSITHKVKWIRDKNYGGIMVFNLNTDDWTKSCGQEDFPLIKIIKKIFN